MAHVQLEIISRTGSGGANQVPLLFVHGAFHAAWCWEAHFLDYFAGRGFSACAVSLRGHGNSDGAGALSRTRVAEYVDDVAWAVRQLPTAPIVIGHSMGALVVQKYVERHSAVAAVLLGPPPPTGVAASVLRIARRHPVSFAKVILTRRLWPLVATPALARDALFSDGLADEQVLHYWRRLQDESFRAFVGMLTSDRPKPADVRTPVLVIGGARDTLITRKEIEATARAYNAPFEILDVPHDMMLDSGWELVASRILTWLTEKRLLRATRDI